MVFYTSQSLEMGELVRGNWGTIPFLGLRSNIREPGRSVGVLLNGIKDVLNVGVKPYIRVNRVGRIVNSHG